MGALVKVQHKGQVTIPTRLRTRAGISEGDLVEASFHRGKIILTPKLPVDRSQFPTADDEYTPAQRRAIDARLAESEEDLKRTAGSDGLRRHGRVGPAEGEGNRASGSCRHG